MKKVEEILQTLTLEEKASLCQGASFWFTKEIAEKGVPAIMMTDGPHGLRKQNGETDHLGIYTSLPATCFPTAAAVCNSWDEDLIYQIGEALGKECRQEEVSVLLGPSANIKRSPLCGRNFEYFSEDPYLSSHMAKSHIQGVQSQGVGTSLKHFALNNQETKRMTVDVVVDERTLREIYLASFETAVKEAKPWTIMAAYNKINGEFCCENHHLMKEILRDEWGYEGVVVSDWGATNDQVKGIPVGFDLRMPYAGEKFKNIIVDAVQNGKLAESELDETVRRLLTLVKKGIENHQANCTFDKEAHNALAQKAAAESAVLLKNEGEVLPISKKDKIAVIGSMAKHVRYQGGGSSNVNPTFLTDVMNILDEQYPEVNYTYARGYLLKKDVNDEEYISEALDSAKNADKITLFLGLPYEWESEGFDRQHMGIPNNQIELLNRLAKLGKPIIAFLFTGASIEMPWLYKVDALVAMYTAGQAVAPALVNILFGEVNPCGKLAETYPMKKGHTPCSLTYPQTERAEYNEGIFVGYRYYEKKDMDVLFPFGYGLSYTKWEYTNLKLDKASMKDEETLTVTVDITNTGTVSGKEIVQLYVRDPESSVPKPIKELKGFKKISAEPGETKTVTMILDKRSFSYYNTQIMDWHVESGTYEIMIGAASNDIRISESVYVESTTVIKKVYDAFITMEELGKIPAGQKLLEQIRDMTMPPALDEEEVNRRLEDEDDMEDAPMDYAAAGQDMPLIKVADTTAGVISDEMVQMILDTINQ